MKISKNGQYALICVADLALHENQGPQSISHIAERQHIDPRYLGQLFFLLKNAGLISGTRGKNGGYRLNKSPGQITAGEVVRAVEGDLAPTKCSIDDEAARRCRTYDLCITRTLWQQIAREINDTLDQITVSAIIEQYRQGGLEK